jgi:hypothetical protein
VEVDLRVTAQEPLQLVGDVGEVAQVRVPAGPADRHPVPAWPLDVEHRGVDVVGQHHHVVVALPQHFGEGFRRHGHQVGDLDGVVDGVHHLVVEGQRRGDVGPVDRPHIVVGLVHELVSAVEAPPQRQRGAPADPLADDQRIVAAVLRPAHVRGHVVAVLGELNEGQLQPVVAAGVTVLERERLDRMRVTQRGSPR